MLKTYINRGEFGVIQIYHSLWMRWSGARAKAKVSVYLFSPAIEDPGTREIDLSVTDDDGPYSE